MGKIQDSIHIYTLTRKTTLAGGEFQREEDCWGSVLEREELALSIHPHGQSLHAACTREKGCGHRGWVDATVEICRISPLIASISSVKWETRLSPESTGSKDTTCNITQGKGREGAETCRSPAISAWTHVCPRAGPGPEDRRMAVSVCSTAHEGWDGRGL